MQHVRNETDALFLQAGEGRTYDCGTMKAVFKADENETAEMYSISEWWLEPNSGGPGPHLHDDNDEIFYGIEGTTSILVSETWLEVKKGDFLRIPAKTIHDFANKTNQQSGVLNFFVPGGFERSMPAITKWFKENK